MSKLVSSMWELLKHSIFWNDIYWLWLASIFLGFAFLEVRLHRIEFLHARATLQIRWLASKQVELFFQVSLIEPGKSPPCESASLLDTVLRTSGIYQAKWGQRWFPRIFCLRNRYVVSTRRTVHKRGFDLIICDFSGQQWTITQNISQQNHMWAFTWSVKNVEEVTLRMPIIHVTKICLKIGEVGRLNLMLFHCLWCNFQSLSFCMPTNDWQVSTCAQLPPKSNDCLGSKSLGIQVRRPAFCFLFLTTIPH